MTTPSAITQAPWVINFTILTTLGYHYNALSLSKSCPRVEKKK